MMTEIILLLKKLRDKKITLSLTSGHDLQLKGNVALLDDEELSFIKKYKMEIITFIKSTYSSLEIKKTNKYLAKDRVPLSPSQKSIWIQIKYENDNTLYCIPGLYTIEGKSIDCDVFKHAVEILVCRNKILSYIINEHDGKPYQKESDILIDEHFFIHDISHVSIEQQGKCIKRQIDDSIKKGFVIDQKPLWEMRLFKLSYNKIKIFIKIHHLIADAQTMEIIKAELFDIYSSIIENKSVENDKIQYHDYVNWLYSDLRNDSISNFWKEYLKEYNEVEEILPTNKNELFSDGRICDFLIDDITSRAINKFVQINSLSLPHLFSLAFAVIISKYSRSEDLVFGIPTQNREHPQLYYLIGNLVNVLPLRVKLDYQKSIIDNLYLIKRDFSRIVDNQSYPLEFILEDIQYERKEHGYPLFNIMLAFSDINNNQEEEDEINYESQTSLYDLTCMILFSDKIQIKMEYNNQMYSPELISSLIHQMLIVISQIIENKDDKLSTLSLLNNREKELLFQKSKSISPISHNSVLDLIYETISKNQNEIAIIDAEQWTYYQLKQQIHLIAQKLIDLGVSSGNRVIVNLPMSRYVISAMLGVWAINAIYIPVDIDIAKKKKDAIIRDTECTVIIDLEFINNLPDINTDSLISANVEKTDIAYLIYTSGSTGIPKGVKMSHGALVSKMREEYSLFKSIDKLITYTVTNPSFDVSFLELLFPLIFGGRVVVCNNNLDVFQVKKDLVDFKVNILQSTPSYFSQILNNITKEEALTMHLKIICLGGEPVRNFFVRKILTYFQEITINNHYGPTEICIDALVKQNINENDDNVIGNSLPDTTVYIVDKFDNPLPIRCVGQILIGGNSVANGYWNIADDNFKFSDSLNEYVYSTGDYAYWMNTEEIKFVGRDDSQIKHKGIRVEIDEINTAINECIPEITNIYTIVYNNTLISFIETDLIIQFDSLIKKLTDKLSSTLIPEKIIVLKQFPITSNGKINSEQLTVMLSKEDNEQTLYPLNQDEIRLVQLWNIVLDRDNAYLGINSTFFSMGGNSLLQFQLYKKICEEFRVNILFRDFLLAQTVQAQVGLIKQSRLNSYENKRSSIDFDKLYPLSNAQKRLFGSCVNLDKRRAYNISSAFKIPFILDVKALEQALGFIYNKYSLINAYFVLDGNNPKYKIRESHDVVLKIVDYSSNVENKDNLYDLLNGFHKEDYDFYTGNLVKVILIRMGKNENILFVGMHHLISDGLSFNLFIKDLYSLYLKITNSENILPEEVSLSYDYHHYVEDEEIYFDSSKTFWEHKLEKPIKKINLPIEKIKKNSNSSGNIDEYRFSKSETALIKQYLKSNNISDFAFYHTIIRILFLNYFNRDELIIASPTLGRNTYESMKVFGYFINMVIYKYKIPLDLTIKDLCIDIMTDINFSNANQYYPYNLIENELIHYTEDSEVGKYMFDTIIAYNDISLDLFNELEAIEFNNQEEKMFIDRIEDIEIEDKNSRFELAFNFNYNKDELSSIIQYDEDLYYQSTINAMNRNIADLILYIVNYEDNDLQVNSLLERYIYPFRPISSSIESHPIPDEEFEPNELKVLSEFQYVLKNSKLFPESDFFTMGGNSISAFKLIENLNKKFDKAIPLNVFYNSPTIRDVSKYIFNKIENANNEIEVFFSQENNLIKGSSLIILPSIFGSIAAYEGLINELSLYVNIYSIQISVLKSDLTVNSEDLNNKIIDVLLKNMPSTASVYLLGYSIGALLAYNVASRLNNIKGLILIDRLPQTPSISDFSFESLWKDYCLIYKLDLIAEGPIYNTFKYLTIYSNQNNIGKLNGTKMIAIQFEQSLSWGDMKEWGDYVSNEIDLYTVEGNHFSFIAPNVIKKISDIILPQFIYNINQTPPIIYINDIFIKIPDSRRKVEDISLSDMLLPTQFNSIDSYHDYFIKNEGILSVPIDNVHDNFTDAIIDMLESVGALVDPPDLVLIATEEEIVQQKLRQTNLCRNCMMINISGNYCANIDLAVKFAKSLLTNEDYENIFILTGSLYNNDSDRFVGTYAILGDGMGALIVSKKRKTSGFILNEVFTYSSPINIDEINRKDFSLSHFQGFSKIVDEIIKKTRMENIDFVIAQNANNAILKQVLAMKGFDIKKMDETNKFLWSHLGSLDYLVNLSKVPSDVTNIALLGIGVNGTYTGTLLEKLI